MTTEIGPKTEYQSNNSHLSGAVSSRLSTVINSRRSILDLLLIVFVIGYSLVGMRNFDLRMANLHVDDGPIFYAHAFKDPSLFAGDFVIGFPVETVVPVKLITSAMVWIPSLLWRYLNIDPYPTTWLITLIQGLSIGLVIYILTISVTGKRVVALLATIFGYITALWHWSLANYGNSASWNFLSYPANLALAPILLGFVYLLQGHHKAVWFSLLVAGLIHPGLTLHACAVVGIYWLWEGLYDRQGTIRRLTGLVAVGILTALPGLLVGRVVPGDPVSHNEFIAGLRQNQHIWPWNYEGLWSLSWQTTLKWLLLTSLSWRWRAKFSPKVQQLWLAALAGAFVLSLSQIIGAVWEIPLLLNLIGLRAWMWPVLIALPLVIYYWYAHLRSGNWLGAILSLLCLALPLYVRQYALFWPLIIGLLLLDVSQGHLAIWQFRVPTWGRYGLQTLVFIGLIIWSISFLAMPFPPEATPKSLFETLAYLTWHTTSPLPAQPDRIKLLIVITILGCLIWGLGWLTQHPPSHFLARYPERAWFALIGFIAVLYGGQLLWTNWQEAERQSVSSEIYTLDVQLWARENTSPSALFVAPRSGWRTMSLRRQLDPFTRESYAYIATQEAKRYRERLLDFYGISTEEANTSRGSRVYQMELDRFWNFTERDFLRFASEFNATHVVLPTYYKYTETTEFNLPLVYENPYYVVYSLDSP